MQNNMNNHSGDRTLAALFAAALLAVAGFAPEAYAGGGGADVPQGGVSQTLRTITGRVVDKATGKPLAGAAIVNMKTNMGTTTTVDGSFTIAAAAGQTLSVSLLGYSEVEIKASAADDIIIEMSESTQLIDDVVVVGYAEQRRVNITGAVSTISGDDIAAHPVVSTIQALQGADPSLNITMSSGNPVASNNVNIRGVPSINGGTPLILVDGVPGVSLNFVNASDIESISVLKDASASAIYGAKASAGVILITTKNGGSGRATVSYSNNFGWSSPTTDHDFITNGYEYATTIHDLYYSRYGYSPFNYTENDWAQLEARRYDKTENPERPWVVVGDDGKYHYYGNFDWYHNIFNTNRFNQEHNVSLSGGNKDINYYVSGRFYEQEGTLSGDMIKQKEYYRNYSFRGKFDAKIFKWAKWTTNAAVNANEQRYPGQLDEGMTIAALEQNLAPMFVPENPDGSIVMYPYDLRNIALATGRTASFMDEGNKHIIENQMFTLSNGLHLTPAKGLSIDATYNLTNYRRLYKDRHHDQVYSRQIGVYETSTTYMKDRYRERHYGYTLHNVDAYLTYNHTWNDAHNFKVLAGMNYERYRSTDLTVQQDGLGSEILDSFKSKKDNSSYTITQDISAYQTLGFFARVNYDYKGRYLFEASLRADATSRFAKESRWGYFPSVSAGWRFSEEPFMEGVSDWWNNGKIRLSYGSLGNQQVADYLYIDRISTDQINYLFDDATKANASSVSAPLATDLTWETVTTYNVGLDLSFLKNRLTFTGDYFIRDTKDMLTTSMTLPAGYGASTPKGNCADLRTKGWEISLSWRDKFDLGGKPFTYAISGSVGDYQSEITKYNNPSRIFSGYYEGKKLGEIWGYHVVGLFKTDEEAAAYQRAINNSTNVYQRIYNMSPTGLGQLMAGDMMFEDSDNSGSIGTGSGTVDDPGDMRVIGNSTPRYNYSFRVELNWNGFDISAFFQGVGKRDWYPTNNQDAIYGANKFWQLYSYPILSFITSDFKKDVWTEDNPNAYFPRLRPIISYNGGPLGVANDRYLQSAAYLRFKNLTVGYTIPVLKQYVKKLRVYFSAENICYWSPLKKHCKLIDPELAVSDGTYRAGTGSGYDLPRTISFGVDITF